MNTDLDIYRTANMLIRSSDAEMAEGVRKHGDDAAIQATVRADEMLEKGDLGSYAVWVEEVHRKERKPGDVKH